MTHLHDPFGDCVIICVDTHLGAPGARSAGASVPAPRPAAPCTRPATAQQTTSMPLAPQCVQIQCTQQSQKQAAMPTGAVDGTRGAARTFMSTARPWRSEPPRAGLGKVRETSRLPRQPPSHSSNTAATDGTCTQSARVGKGALVSAVMRVHLSHHVILYDAMRCHVMSPGYTPGYATGGRQPTQH